MTATRFQVAAERPQLVDLAPVVTVHAYSPVEQVTACGRTLGDLELFESRSWPPRGRGLVRCEACDQAVTAVQASGEPIIETTMVEWTRNTADGAAAGADGCHIGERVYRGRAGERAEMPTSAAEVLQAAGFVTLAAEAGQAQ